MGKRLFFFFVHWHNLKQPAAMRSHCGLFLLKFAHCQWSCDLDTFLIPWLFDSVWPCMVFDTARCFILSPSIIDSDVMQIPQNFWEYMTHISRRAMYGKLDGVLTGFVTGWMSERGPANLHLKCWSWQVIFLSRMSSRLTYELWVQGGILKPGSPFHRTAARHLPGPSPSETTS
jgi:hypothetical protein